MPVEVEVEQGRLAGTATADGAVRAFRAVPYAKAPVGPLRWRAPEPPETWPGTRAATAFGPAAPQLPPLPHSL